MCYFCNQQMFSLKNSARIVLLVVFCVTLFGAMHLPKLAFNYDFERFFPKGDDDLEFYLEHRALFESDNDFLLISIENKKGVFNLDFLNKVKALSDSIKRLELVHSVISPTSIARYIKGPFGAMKVPYIHLDAKRLQADSIQIFQEKHLDGALFSSSKPAICLLVNHEQYLKKKASDTLLIQIERAVSTLDFDQVFYSGKIHGQFYYIQKIKWQMGIFMTSSFLLVLLFLFFSFKNLRAILVPIYVVTLSLLWLFSIMALCDEKIDVIASLMPTILFIVGVSDTIHFYTRYFELARGSNNYYESILQTIKEVGWATFLTSLTTAIGFATLITAKIEPVQTFGLYTSIGVFIAFIITYLSLPAMLYLAQKSIIPEQHLKTDRWKSLLDFLFLTVLKNQKKIMVGSIALVFVCLIGISRLTVNNFLLEDLSDRDALKKGYLYIEQYFSGARPFEFALWSDSSLFNYQDLSELNQVSDYLDQQYGLKLQLSLVELIKETNRFLKGGALAQRVFPNNEAEFLRIKKQLEKRSKSMGLNTLISQDHQRLRFTGKIPDWGGKATDEKDLRFTEFLSQNLPEHLNYKVTGMAKLIDKNNAYLIENMFKGLGISFLLVSIIMALLYRSFWIIVISLVCNILPLIMIAAFMGFTGMYLNISTSIIFTIAFGIAVDDTIHFLSKLKADLKKFSTVGFALKHTYYVTGKAILVTTLITSAGFLTLIGASFNSIFNIGLLVSLTLIFAVFADLILLPVLILRWKKRS